MKHMILAACLSLTGCSWPFGQQRVWDTTPNLPKYGVFTDVKAAKYASMIRLHLVDGPFICTGVVIDEHYALTAAHCIRDVEELEVWSNTNEDIGLVADVAAYNLYQDVALLYSPEGSFRSFAQVPADFDGSKRDLRFIIACGYPAGQKTAFCGPITNIEPLIFQIAGKGLLYPGMSGGPVIDLAAGRIMGVNSASGPGFVVIGPVYGLAAEWGIE